jgi:periplasmic mercuric ion binding protein
MKKQLILSIAVMLLVGFTAYASKTETVKFKVSGNCGMCEKTIEKAANGIKGVSRADWNKKTKIIEVTFNPDKTTQDDIHQAIADVGYDTDKVKASDDVYNKLHKCCKYDRDQ